MLLWINWRLKIVCDGWRRWKGGEIFEWWSGIIGDSLVLSLAAHETCLVQAELVLEHSLLSPPVLGGLLLLFCCYSPLFPFSIGRN